MHNGFILGDVIQDANILEVAREDAQALLKHIHDPGYEQIKNYIDMTIARATYLD